jgi:hypothetical protein
MKEIRLRGRGRILAVGANSALVADPSPRGVQLIRVEVPRAPTGDSLK